MFAFGLERRRVARQVLKKILVLAACLSLVALAFAPHPVLADATDGKTVVRVGWYESALFQSGMSDEQEKSGYSYEYLQKVADYTSWQYE